MKFIKVFADDAAYKVYRDSGSNYIKPNLSLSRGSKTVFYNLDANDKPYVDLGLPSGTLWATMNVGASKPSDAGIYFQWGDTAGYTKDQVGTGDGKKKFAGDWSDYKWYLSGNSYTNVAFTKYTTLGAKLDLEDDAAHANMKGDWHMPTPEQIQELLDNTTTALTISDDVSGMTFTSTNDTSKFIFVPYEGCAFNGSVQDSGDFGYFWSTNLNMNEVCLGSSIILEDDAQFPMSIIRCVGLPTRGVLG